MAHSLGAAYDVLGTEYNLVSYTIHFLAPIRTGRDVVYNAMALGGGHTIKYITVSAEQAGVCAMTHAVFSKREESTYGLVADDKTEKTDIEEDPKPFAEHCAEQIGAVEGQPVAEVWEKYKIVFHVLNHFHAQVAMSWVGNERFVVRLQFGIWSARYYCQAVAYISDMLLVQCASFETRFPWYDPQRATIASLKQTISYACIDESKIGGDSTMDCFLSAECTIFHEGKAFIRGVLADACGNTLCTMEQIALLRIRK